jgi:hypothetical protein
MKNEKSRFKWMYVALFIAVFIPVFAGLNTIVAIITLAVIAALLSVIIINEARSAKSRKPNLNLVYICFIIAVLAQFIRGLDALSAFVILLGISVIVIEILKIYVVKKPAIQYELWKLQIVLLVLPLAYLVKIMWFSINTISMNIEFPQGVYNPNTNAIIRDLSVRRTAAIGNFIASAISFASIFAMFFGLGKTVPLSEDSEQVENSVS